jgi:hypothetical protein
VERSTSLRIAVASEHLTPMMVARTATALHCCSKSVKLRAEFCSPGRNRAASSTSSTAI